MLTLGLFAAGAGNALASNFCANVAGFFRREFVASESSPEWLVPTLAKMMRKGDPFGQKEFYDLLETRSDAEIMNLLQRWDRFHVTGKLRVLAVSGLGRYKALLADPGISARTDQFIKFASTRLAQVRSLSLFEMRQAFAAHLGTRTVYRGMRITAAEVEAFAKDGIDAPALRFGNEWRRVDYYDGTYQEAASPTDYAEQAAGDFANKGPRTAVENQTRGVFKASSFMSVTNHQKLAASMAYNAKDVTGKQSPFVFEIEVPVISMISARDVFGKDDGVMVVVGRENLGRRDDPKVESFAMFHLDASWIRDIKPVVEPQPKVDFY